LMSANTEQQSINITNNEIIMQFGRIKKASHRSLHGTSRCSRVRTKVFQFRFQLQNVNQLRISTFAAFNLFSRPNHQTPEILELLQFNEH
jgi:UDP-N-acetylglucosamine transferase subunit ALG13